MFAQVKAYLRRHQYSPLSDLQRLDDALSQITVSQAIRYFADCGFSLGADARAWTARPCWGGQRHPGRGDWAGRRPHGVPQRELRGAER